MEVDGMKFQVKAVGGDDRLGGRDFDLCLVDHCGIQTAESIRFSRRQIGWTVRGIAHRAPQRDEVRTQP